MMEPTIAITTWSISLLLFASSLSTLRAAELPGPMGSTTATADGPYSFDIKKKATYDFGSYKGATVPEAGGVRLKTKSGQGGAGWITKLDLSKAADFTPALTVTVGPGNKATKIMLCVGSQKVNNSYTFDLSKLTPGTSATVLAEDAASLADPPKPMPEDKKKDFNLANVTVLQFMGDWGPLPVDVLVEEFSFVAPTAEMKAQRTAAVGKKAAAAEKAAKAAAEKEKLEQELLTKGAPHLPDGPQVVQVCAVATDVLTVTIQAGEQGVKKLAPYVAQPGDEIVDGKTSYKEFVEGKEVTVKNKIVKRMVDGKLTEIGPLLHNGKFTVSGGGTVGKMLDERIASAPASYFIQSTDDAAYAQPVSPAEVFRKGKPNGFSNPLPVLHTISLKLPTSLKEGATYSIRFFGINTAKETVTYTHYPKKTPSLAVHAIQTGYRPDDTFKRAYLSFWMGVNDAGKNGSTSYTASNFELLDSAGKSVFTGKIELAKENGKTEQISIQETVDYSKSAVSRLDFSTFNTPGEYRVFVPGIGTSGPFKIAANVWEQPFKAAMHGILIQRSGMDLGPPFTEFFRPRPFHPDDGVQFYQMTIPLGGGQEGGRGKNLSALAAEGKLEKVTGISGGYQDAGDWDTLGYHLQATYDMLGMHNLNPEAFAKTKLLLPANEMNNNLPDILDEALWQMPMWKKLQMPDGGVRGGYGYGWGCPDNITSDMIKSVGVYAPDVLASYWFAACAARASGILENYDKKLAAEYLACGKRAFDWAEKSVKAQSASEGIPISKKDQEKRTRASVELFAITKDPAYDAVFKEASECLGDTPPKMFSELEGNFAYARLPEGLGDPEAKKKIVAAFVSLADQAIEMSKKNAFDLIAGMRTDIPIIFVGKFFSTPAQGGMGLIYAYELTKKPEYLTAAIQGSNHCLGANPDNFSYTTGVGYNSQRNTFRVDALRNGQASNQKAMMGHIPYGQGNEGNKMSSKMNAWVQQYKLNFGKEKKMIPNWYNWPVYEQYIDFSIYPLHNENTFNDTTTPAACYWFWLNNRP